MRKVLVIILVMTLTAAGTAAVAWPFLKQQSALSVSYAARIQDRETLVVNLYETLSGVGFFRSTASRLTRDATNHRQRIHALMEWAHEHVRPQYAAPNRVVADNFYDIVRRGFGYCDQTAHVFATLAHYAGYDSRLLYLWDANGKSPHTAAEALVDGRWVVVDPWQGVVWENSAGDLLSAADGTPDLLARWGYDRWNVRPEYFAKGTEFRTFPYQTPVAFAEKVWAKLAHVPVAPDPRSTGLVPLASAAAGPAGGRPSASPEAGLSTETRLKYDEARRAHIGGEYERSIALYEQVRGAVSPEMREAVGFFHGAALFRAGRLNEAIRSWSAALAAGAGGWEKSILQYRGQALERVGDRDGATADYRAADIPPTRALLMVLESRR